MVDTWQVKWEDRAGKEQVREYNAFIDAWMFNEDTFMSIDMG